MRNSETNKMFKMLESIVRIKVDGKVFYVKKSNPKSS